VGRHPIPNWLQSGELSCHALPNDGELNTSSALTHSWIHDILTALCLLDNTRLETTTNLCFQHHQSKFNMDLYKATFAGSLVLNAFAFYQSHRSRKAVVSETSIPDKKDEHEHVEPDTEGLSKLRKRFFPIYLLVNAADWLQGPYIYPIYKGTFSTLKYSIIMF
jgi:hypothetical protein